MRIDELPIEDILQVLGHRLKMARIDKRFSRERLSELSGISPKHIYQVEKGGNISIKLLHGMTEAMGLTYQQLFADIPNKNPLESLEAPGAFIDETSPQYREEDG